MYDDQEEEKVVNLGLRKGGGDKAMTTSVRKASDWLFRTGPSSTQQGGAVMSATIKWGEVGSRPCLARRSTALFMASSAWALVQEKRSFPEWARIEYRRAWKRGLWEENTVVVYVITTWRVGMEKPKLLSVVVEKRGKPCHPSLSMARRLLQTSPRTKEESV